MKNTAKQCVLGVTVTSRALHAVLVQGGVEGPEIVRRFNRQRAGRSALALGASGTNLPGQVPGMDFDEAEADVETTGTEDFTIQFGEGGGGDLFLGSEFAGMETNGTEVPGEASTAAPPATFEMELGDILDECRDAGYEHPDVAFAVGSSKVTCVEIVVPPRTRRKSDKGGKAKKESDGDRKAEPLRKAEPAPEREQLLGLLREQHAEPFDAERVAFLPMVDAEDGMPRVLAIVPETQGAVEATLALMREQKTRRLPAARVLDTEVPLYLGLARAARHVQPPAEGDPEAFAPPSPQNDTGKTLVVRAGVEDTLVLFMEDDRLLRFESLRSITTYDAPETICSRVLLLQDEYGIGEMGRVLLLSDEREGALVESFKMFFHDAQVDSLRRYLPRAEGEERPAADGTSGVVATAVAMRLTNDVLYADAFEPVNLLPKQLLRRQIRLPFTWHIPALAVLLFVTVLFFVFRYFQQEGEIADQRERVQAFPELLTANPKTLQARIDSLQNVSTQYLRAIDVLDSLLIGSDRWSRALDETSEAIGSVSGVWVEAWRPETRQLRVTGTATSRDRVVALAQAIEGEIESLTFSEIREWPVYSFSMRIPLPAELPEAARYLRERAAEQFDAEHEGVTEQEGAEVTESGPAGSAETAPVRSAAYSSSPR